MSGMIGGLFGGGEDSGGSTTNISQTQNKKDSQMINYQDPETEVNNYSDKYTEENEEDEKNGFNLSDLYRSIQQQPTQGSSLEIGSYKPSNTSRPGGIMSMFIGK